MRRGLLDRPALPFGSASRFARGALVLVALAGCETELDQRLAIGTEPRVLAIVATPAECAPGDAIAYTALVAGPGGAIEDPRTWAFCTSPKSPTEDNSASVGCVAGDGLIGLLGTTTASGSIPLDACQTFGPDTVAAGFRPRDPDPSGGYFQPVRLAVGDLLAIGLSRVTCDLPNAPGAVAIAYRQGYVANVDPVLHPLALPAVHAGDAVELVAAWDPPETYLYYDQLAQVLVTRREAMRISFFATAGAMDRDAVARAEDDPESSGATTWHAPATPGRQTLFLVLRDSRGGIATQSRSILVE